MFFRQSNIHNIIICEIYVLTKNHKMIIFKIGGQAHFFIDIHRNKIKIIQN